MDYWYKIKKPPLRGGYGCKIMVVLFFVFFFKPKVVFKYVLYPVRGSLKVFFVDIIIAHDNAFC